MLYWQNYRGTVKTRGDNEQIVDSPVSGTRAGYWGVHKNTHDHKWSITHTKTGLYLQDNMRSKKHAKDLVEHLSKSIYGFAYFSMDRLKNNRDKISESLTEYFCEDWKERS